MNYDCCACGGAEGNDLCRLCRLDLKPWSLPLTNAEKVGEFHRAFDVPEPSTPTVPSEDTLVLRGRLISEEYLEVVEEVEMLKAGVGNLSRLAKELADLLVVTYGTARACGIDIDAVFAEVHRSNMSKLGVDGKPIRREDGKVLKGPNYSPADVAKVLGV